MAPEQINGGHVDQRSDLFAFGCVLYEMIAGQRAFEGANLHDTLNQILSSPAQPSPDELPGVPLRLGWLLAKLLAKSPRQRYQAAAAQRFPYCGESTEIAESSKPRTDVGATICPQ